MAWYSDATHYEIAAGKHTGRHTPVRVVLHTAVSNARNLYKGGPIGGAFSHFYIAQDGTVFQYVDTGRQAAADLQGNNGSISVETWDGGGRRGLTDAQVEAFGRLLAWAWGAHPTIPKVIATWASTKGLAWHRLGCQGNFGRFTVSDRATWSREQTGAVWSNARGKECPWPEKIRQVDDIYAVAIGKDGAGRHRAGTVNVDGGEMYIVRRQGDGAHYLITPGAMRHIGSPSEVAAWLKIGLKIVDVSAAEAMELMSGTNLQAAVAVQTANAVKDWKL